MLNYEQIKNFANLLEQDQEPNDKVVSYEEGRKVYAIRFETDYYGRVSVDCHVQWPVLEQMMVGRDWSIAWSAGDTDSVHLKLIEHHDTNVSYSCVLFKHDLRELWDRIHATTPFPKDTPAVMVWEKLYNRGVWEV